MASHAPGSDTILGHSAPSVHVPDLCGQAPQLPLLVCKPHSLALVSESNVITRGPDKVAIYNEGFAEASGKAHPFLMGHTFRDTYPEIVDNIMPVFEMAKKTKMDFQVIEMPLMVMRNNFLEETIFTGDFIPVRDDNGRVNGWYNTLAEITRQKITDRRRNMLNMLCLLYTSPSPRDGLLSRMPSSA